MFATLRFIALFTVVGFVVFSCNERAEVTDENVDEYIEEGLTIDSALVKKGAQKDLDYIIENMYFSDDLVKILASQQNLYDEQLLLNVKKLVEYQTSKTKAVNMGVLGADLNYILHFGQTQTSFKYLIGAKQLANQIGVALAFDQKVLDQYQSNFNQKDSLINIVYTAYDNVRKHLRNGEQFQVTTLVIAGSWVENMYLTSMQIPQFTSVEKRIAMYGIIFKQDEYLDKIIGLLTNLNDDNDPFVKKVIEELEGVALVYDSFKGKSLLEASDVALLHEKIAITRNNFIGSN